LNAQRQNENRKSFRTWGKELGFGGEFERGNSGKKPGHCELQSLFRAKGNDRKKGHSESHFEYATLQKESSRQVGKRKK